MPSARWKRCAQLKSCNHKRDSECIRVMSHAKIQHQLLTDTSHETATKMMQLNDYLDVLIPRGGAGLIKSVVKNSTVPVIETGTGNCHVYVDEFAQKDMAVNIIINAKTQRLGTYNTCESLSLT